MKQVKKMSATIRSVVAFLMLFFVQSIAWAQDKKVDVDIAVDKGDGEWYARPWVWIVGGAVFLLLLVALLRGGKKE
ncbi:MAG: hypothetical protein ABIQ56_06415 [Chitinophagaceae bacterium]